MSLDIKKLLEQERKDKLREKKRLKLIKNAEVLQVNCDGEQQVKRSEEQEIPLLNLTVEDSKENLSPQPPVSCCLIETPPQKEQSLPLVERLDFSSNERDKQAFIDKLVNSENPLTVRLNEIAKHSMFRYGEYSPNNPHLRVTAAPYVGLGEYDQKRQIILQKQKADYLEHISKKNEGLRNIAKGVFLDTRPLTTSLNKLVQTDIQNIRNKLVQYELQSQDPAEKELNPQVGSTLHPQTTTMHGNRSPMSHRFVDQRLTSAQNSFLKPESDKPKSILRSGSPRERLMSDLQHSYVPSFMDGFSYQEGIEDKHEREKLKHEAYQSELRQQIEEKRRLSALREEQERREQELASRRLEQQLLRMQEEQLIRDQRHYRRNEQIRRNSDDLLRHKHELQTRASYARKHTDSESSVSSSVRNANKQLSSHYSPPVARRNPYSFNIPSTSVFADPGSRYNPNHHHHHNNPYHYRLDAYATPRRDALNRMDSLSSFDNVRASKYNDTFNRHDSLSRIDTLGDHRRDQDFLSGRLESLSIGDWDRGGGSLNRVQRRHSATQQDLRRSPKLQRKGSGNHSKYDDALPIPVLKAHSPVAKELRNSVAVNSSRRSSSEAVRKLEDKWQIPAVQRNIINHGDSRDGQNRSILTQLGAIRMQLQQEQMRMDETLRKRGITQSKAVDFHC